MLFASPGRCRYCLYVTLPIVLSFLATLTAAFMAYGVDSRWDSYPWGLSLIMAARRLQWPMIALSLILCIALLGMVIAGRRRAWWLIALAPVLALFGHRFVTDPINRYEVAEDPAFIAAADAAFIGEHDYIAGVVFNDRAYAYPYACLYESPVVVQSDRDQRMLLMWSPHANAATALLVSLELKARDLDISSEPGGGLLIHAARRGQFIAAVTGRTPVDQELPAGIKSRLPVAKTTWREWKSRRPDTLVMVPHDRTYDGPTRPLARSADDPMVALVNSESPVVLRPEEVTPKPIHATAGAGPQAVPIFVFRDPEGRIRAFDRRVEADLIPRFTPTASGKRKGAFIDSDTESGWNVSGVAIDGPAKGKKLRPIDVQEDVRLQAARFWYPGLSLPSAPMIRPSD